MKRTTTAIVGAACAAVLAAAAGSVHAEQGVVRVFTFEGYTDEEWVSKFEEQTGCEVNSTFTGSVDEMFAKMRGSDGADYDLISIDTSLFSRYIEQDLIQPYDASKLPNMSQLLPAFQSVKEAEHEGEMFGVPIAWGSLGLIYDTDEVSPAPTSWEILWDEKYAGRIIVLDDTNNNIVNTAIILGYEDPFNLDESQLQEVKEKLIDQKKGLLSYFAGFEEGNNVWESGNAILMFSMGEFQAVDLKNRGYNVEYVIPEEGAVGWLDTWALSKGAEDVECAHQYVNFYLEPWVGTRMTEKYGYGNTTSATEGLDYADRLVWLAPAEDFSRRTEIWNEVKATPVQ